MANKVCPECGGAVSKKNKHNGALCSSCAFAYKHTLGDCTSPFKALRLMMRGDKVFCARCKQLMVLKADKELKPLQSDIDLMDKLGIMRKEIKDAARE